MLSKMANINFQPWPSTYEMGEIVEPKKIVPNTEGRKVGAFRTLIPPMTIEPPQIHLIAPRDGKPFQELLTDLDNKLVVGYFDPKTRIYFAREYFPGQDIIIPEYTIHWLMNLNSSGLSFTCEYAPHPWDGENDEPEFPNLAALLDFVRQKGLEQKLMGCNLFYLSHYNIL